MTPRRETVAVLVADIVGSTQLRQTIGETRYRRRCRRIDEVTRMVIERHHGRVLRGQGDGVVATFPAASDGLDTGVAIFQAVADLNQRAPVDEIVALRIGVSAGEVVWDNGECEGLPLVEAARLESAAEPDTLICSDLASRLADADLNDSLGDLHLKGLRAPVLAWRVPWHPNPTHESLGLPDALAGQQRLPFVGRRSELGTLIGAWEQTRDGGGRLVTVAGEPGVGKTRVCRELAQHVLGGGGLVLYGRADEVVGYPFLPFVEALRGYIGSVARPEMTPSDAAELARLVPELRTLLPGIGEPRAADSDTQRYLLFDAMAGWLRSMSNEDPVLLVLDDLTWATEPTVAMLRHIATSVAAAPVLLVVTYRPAEVSTFLDDALADLGRRVAFDRVVLGGLHEEDILAALHGLLEDTPVDEHVVSLVRDVWRKTGGNPFFFGEIFADMVARGSLHPGSLQGSTGPHPAVIPMPHAVEDVVRRRVASLSSQCRQVLELASVVGVAFDPQVLEQASTLAADSVTDAVEEAERAGLLQSSEEISRYTFSHAIVRDVVYSGIAAVRKAATHHRVGRVIEALHSGRLDDHYEDLAHHYAHAPSSGDASRAVMYSREAARRATDRLAHGEAVALYDQALALLARADTGDSPNVRVSLLVDLGVAQHRSGFREAHRTLLEAAHLAASIGDASLCARAVLAGRRGIFSSTGHTDEKWVEVHRAALDLIGDTDLRARAVLLANLSVELSFTGDHTEQDRLSDEALSIARDLGDLGTLVRVMSLRLVTLWRADRVSERLVLADELERLCERYRRPQATINVATMACQAAMEAGDFRAADERLKTIDDIAAQLRQPLILGYARLRQSMRAAVAGDLDVSEKLAREAYEYCEAAGEPDARGFWVGQQFNIRFHQGRLAETVDELRRAADDLPGIVAFRAALAMVHAELGRTMEARMALDAIFGPEGTGVPDDLNWLTSMAFAAHAAAYLGDIDLCSQLLTALLPYRNQFVDNSSTFFGSVERYVGLMLSSLARHEEAASAFQKAAAAHERLGAPLLLARTRLEWAEALLAAGPPVDGSLANRLLDEALWAAQKYSLASVERRARERKHPLLDGVASS